MADKIPSHHVAARFRLMSAYSIRLAALGDAGAARSAGAVRA
jgi:hypothetical protein